MPTFRMLSVLEPVAASGVRCCILWRSMLLGTMIVSPLENLQDSLKIGRIHPRGALFLQGITLCSCCSTCCSAWGSLPSLPCTFALCHSATLLNKTTGYRGVYNVNVRVRKPRKNASSTNKEQSPQISSANALHRSPRNPVAQFFKSPAAE